MPGPKVVPVRGYSRMRFGKRENVQRHKRGRRSKSPGGYQIHRAGPLGRRKRTRM